MRRRDYALDQQALQRKLAAIRREAFHTGTLYGIFIGLTLALVVYLIGGWL